FFFFFSSRRRHTRCLSDWSSDMCSSDLVAPPGENAAELYKQALARNGSDPRAAAGMEKVIGKLLSAAEAQLAAQHLDEAQKLTRSEERRVGKECRMRERSDQYKEKDEDI